MLIRKSQISKKKGGDKNNIPDLLRLSGWGSVKDYVVYEHTQSAASVVLSKTPAEQLFQWDFPDLIEFVLQNVTGFPEPRAKRRKPNMHAAVAL